MEEGLSVGDVWIQVQNGEIASDARCVRVVVDNSVSKHCVNCMRQTGTCMRLEDLGDCHRGRSKKGLNVVCENLKHFRLLRGEKNVEGGKESSIREVGWHLYIVLQQSQGIARTRVPPVQKEETKNRTKNRKMKRKEEKKKNKEKNIWLHPRLFSANPSD